MSFFKHEIKKNASDPTVVAGNVCISQDAIKTDGSATRGSEAGNIDFATIIKKRQQQTGHNPNKPEQNVDSVANAEVCL